MRRSAAFRRLQEKNTMANHLKRGLLVASFAALAAAAANGMTLALAPSMQSPQPVGTLVTFTTAVSDAPGAQLWYRFRVRRQGGEYRLIRDYGPVNTLDWTAATHEGDYDIEVSVRDLDTGGESIAAALFTFQSRVLADQPVVSPTANSLVFLYSAPACPAAARSTMLNRACYDCRRLRHPQSSHHA
jgi:hypothetical protein